MSEGILNYKKVSELEAAEKDHSTGEYPDDLMFMIAREDPPKSYKVSLGTLREYFQERA